MKRLLAITIMATGAALSMSLGGVKSAQAADFTYNYKGQNGYSATGSFSYDDNAPPTISEAGTGATKYLKSISFSVFDTSNKLLGTGNPVTNGNSTDSFFKFNFDTQAKQIQGLDTTTSKDANGISYYLSNFVNSTGALIPSAGSTYYLFSNNTQTNTLLDSASSVQVKATAVPEPSLILGLAVAGLGGVILKKKTTSLNA